MAVQKENYLVTVEEDCSSFGEDDYSAGSADSELELGDLNSSDDIDEFDRESPQSNRSTNSSLVRPYRTETIYGAPYPTVRTQHNVNHDIVDEGLRLYLMFLRQEITRNSLQAPEYLNRQNRAVPRNIASLRALADQFSTSAQRQWIRHQAQIVPLQSLNFHTFTDVLVGLFQEGGVTWERILVLFFFCTDISIRALREQLIHQFRRITNWATRFIQDTVCRWVELEGGWAVIFQQSLNHATKFAILGFCCVGIIALCIYIRNNTNK